jgi:hypothetical protein
MNAQLNAYIAPTQETGRTPRHLTVVKTGAVNAFLSEEQARARVYPFERPAQMRNHHDDIVFGLGVTTAHKNGWCLIGDRFTTNKAAAIEHTKRIDRMLKRD